MNTALQQRIQRICADIFTVPVEHLTLATSPETVEAWDSVNHLNLVLAMEQEFAVQFTPEEIEQLISIERIAQCVDEKLHAAGQC
jgi:acyl carrier protein